MSRRRKNRPSAPRKLVVTEAEIAANTEAVAVIEAERRAERAEDRRVKAMPGGTVNRDDRPSGKTIRRVLDVVHMMERTKDETGRPLIGAEESGAVRMLEGMIEKANGGGGSCLSTLERVNGQSTGDPALATVIRKVDAAKDLERVRRGLGPRTWSLLRELADGNLGLARWHNVVERQTGETNPKGQGAIVRQAFRDLAAVMRAVKTQRPAIVTGEHLLDDKFRSRRDT